MSNYKQKWQKFTELRRRTALVNILVIVALPFFIYLGYKDGIWSMMIICLIIFPFILRNAYKYFFDVRFRENLNKYHDEVRKNEWFESGNKNSRIVHIGEVVAS
jgi:hypothetical protein